MKNSIFKSFLAIILFLFVACSSTNRMTMGITMPAQVSIAADVAHIGIINRSVASEKNKTLDKIDKILSLEGLNLDKEGAENTLLGLQYELDRGNRFKTIKIIDGQEDIKKGLGVFPAALSWEIVEELCKKNKVDILFSLEFYDTDTAVDYEMTKVKLPYNLGILAEVPGHRIELNTIIKNGWRVYDPASRTIVDEYISNDQVLSKGEGLNPIKALEAIIGRKEAVLSRSTMLGTTYALFIEPEHIRIARDYFVRGSDNFVVAKRRAQAGNWQGAADLWKQDLNHPKRKIAGRACYNMAIINEINGDLEGAIDWASKSYSDYGTRNALPYINILRNRVIEKQVLENQLSKLNFNELGL